MLKSKQSQTYHKHTFTNIDVFHTSLDLTEAVPETERLDSSLQKAKAQLSIKTRRHRPSRTRLRDSVSSIDGDDCIDRMVCKLYFMYLITSVQLFTYKSKHCDALCYLFFLMSFQSCTLLSGPSSFTILLGVSTVSESFAVR